MATNTKKHVQTDGELSITRLDLLHAFKNAVAEFTMLNQEKQAGNMAAMVVLETFLRHLDCRMDDIAKAKI